ncbi:helix-turn-helix domain-containing protein [Acidaminobacter sp.]|uniref:helix-turn-helix domain-containing protein n=1 Tax=Acidaminobacter sp. TaxID=1872102 RepID=UPI00256A8FFB|nr:helix-turn-helix transcriptional regulator [Acidaminobacter sp.]MDK9711208.1 helix-turn-helix domain-containing protein [Acidaminobacter sp.]
MNSAKAFGDFISQRRYAKGITVRKMAELISMSPGYYNDIEKGRRNPPDSEVLNKLITVLSISEEDQIEFYDLVGKAREEVSPDLPNYIMQNEVVRVALRIAKEKASPEDWRKFIDDLEKK